MQKNSVWCVGWLMTIATILSPQLAIAAPGKSTDAIVQPDARERSMRLEIRLSQRRVNVYQNNVKVKSYSIAIGRPGWETPKGNFKVQQMLRNPVWIHPFTGEEVPGGDPENPLGRYWIGFWTNGKNWIGFHGTPTPKSVGTAASHGCVRMYNQDIQELFAKVSLGTEVSVID